MKKRVAPALLSSVVLLFSASYASAAEGPAEDGQRFSIRCTAVVSSPKFGYRVGEVLDTYDMTIDLGQGKYWHWFSPEDRHAAVGPILFRDAGGMTLGRSVNADDTSRIVFRPKIGTYHLRESPEGELVVWLSGSCKPIPYRRPVMLADANSTDVQEPARADRGPPTRGAFRAA